MAVSLLEDSGWRKQYQLTKIISLAAR